MLIKHEQDLTLNDNRVTKGGEFVSKVPCDPAVGNLRLSKHRRVACVVLACGVAMDKSVLSLGYI